jgi:hypothetical protein
MFSQKSAVFAALIALCSCCAPLVKAQDEDVQALRAEILKIKETYEARLAEMESRLADVGKEKAGGGESAPARPASAKRMVKDNSFNPSIGLILNGQYNHFSSDEGEIAGFAVGHEGERPGEGFGVDHTELNFTANVDDKFFGSTTAAIAQHEGEMEVELEEAYIQALPGLGLPAGMTVKAGRAFWTLGYLNEHHSHSDDFADRPLPYRVFFNEAFNDDGFELSYLLATEIYSEIGAGLFRGDDFPFGGAEGSGAGAWSVFGRVGGDLDSNQSWRLGGYLLSGDVPGGRVSNEDELTYLGDVDLYLVDLRYTWAPTGNARQKEVTFQGEYFWRNENGSYQEEGGSAVASDGSSSGWYAQAVYKFAPQWRVGLRTSQLQVANGLGVGVLDSQGHDPKAYSVMLDWTNSEFSRVRLQYNREELAQGQDDDQIILQYIMSIGAHGAHKY